MRYQRQRVVFLACAGGAVVTAVLVFFLRDSPATRAQCTEMLDHYIDMTMDADPALEHLAPAQREVAREMKRAMHKTGKSFGRVQDQCEAEVRRHEYDCAMRAKTPNDWEACID